MNKNQPTFVILVLIAILAFSITPYKGNSQVVKKPDTLSLVFTGDDAYPPFEYLDDNGIPSGFDVELMQAIAEVMGIKLRIILGDWYQNLESFKEEQYDGLVGAYYTEERGKEFLFGDPYLNNYHTIFVRKGSSFHNLNDLQKHEKPKVITQNSDILINYIKSFNSNAEITIVRNYEQALRLLAQGTHDCAIISRVLGEYHIDKYALTNIEAMQEEFLPRQYSFAIHKHDTILLSILNQGLTIIRGTGEYEKIYNNHLKKYQRLSVAERYFQPIMIGAAVLVFIIILFYIYIFILRRKVHEKTNELAVELKEKEKAQDLLKIERDKARESDKLKSAFLANMSHEIRTPMNAIVGFSRLLEEPDITDEERKEYVNIINKNSETLLALINDIIDLSKIESGHVTVEKVEFNINNSIKAFKETVIHDLRAKGKEEIKVITQMPLNDPEAVINTDVVRFNQIFTNLLSNSAKFTQKGYIKFGYTTQNNGFFNFFVEDTGIGISKEKQEVVFEQFRQADESYTRKYGGTGLGLTICKELVHVLGGEIMLQSKEKLGTTISFTLPQKEL
jgi:signal transduction histidine kinase